MTREQLRAVERWTCLLVAGLCEPRRRQDVVVNIVEDMGIVMVLLVVPVDDMPFVVGRHGANADAIRTLIKAALRADKWLGKVDIKIVTAPC